MMSDSPNEEVPSRNRTWGPGLNGEFAGKTGLERPNPNRKLLTILGVSAAVYPIVTSRGSTVFDAPKPGRLVLTKVRPGLIVLAGLWPYLTKMESLPPRRI